MQLSALKREPGHCNWQLKTPWPGTAGIDKEDTLAFFQSRPMGMSTNHCRKSSRNGIDMKQFEIMQDIET